MKLLCSAHIGDERKTGGEREEDPQRLRVPLPEQAHLARQGDFKEDGEVPSH